MEALAHAYLRPARTVSLPGAPGSRMDFRAGVAELHDPRNVLLALAMDNCTVEPMPRYVDHWRGWVRDCTEWQPARADIALPGGLVFHPPDYEE